MIIINYENFNYFFNYQKSDEFFDKNKYFNYLSIGSNLNFLNDYKNNISSLNSKVEKNIEKSEHFNVLDNYLHLEYFKDNKFYSFGCYASYDILRLFEYTDSTFKLLNTHKINIGEMIISTNLIIVLKVIIIIFLLF